MPAICTTAAASASASASAIPATATHQSQCSLATVVHTHTRHPAVDSQRTEVKKPTKKSSSVTGVCDLISLK
jgi:hypothetical protein